MDVNGSSIVSGNLTIRGSYYGDSLNNVKIGGVSAKTNTGLQPASSISTPWPDTNPETNVSLIIDDKNNILLINNGDNIYTGGFFLTTDSTTGFNGVSTGSFGFSWEKTQIQHLQDLMTSISPNLEEFMLTANPTHTILVSHQM